MINDCLIELGTEELPPGALKSLSQSFAELMQKSLEESDFKSASIEVFATPRRLALLFRDISLQQPDQTIVKRGPAIQAAFDADGNPSRAAMGFARSCGVEVGELSQRETDKGSWLFFEKTEPGLSLQQVLPGLLDQALASLPIPRRMRWGEQNDEFVRPLKWLVLMIGDEAVKTSVFGVKSSTTSYGHRFHAPGKLNIGTASEYENILLSQGMITASFERRKHAIRSQVEKTASRLGGKVHIDDDLLEEVTALVEYPVAVSGEFDLEFLQVPQEALVMTMQDNQKYFAVFDEDNNLLPYFITISNIDSKKPDVVARGNERVIRPRFSDAQFFFQQDQKQPLSSVGPRLETVVFQEQLGSIADKVKRIASLAEYIAKKTGADQSLVNRAAELCKCDLMSDMVGEFPKLQGVMGRYYAEHDQENSLVSTAIEQHYWPRYAGDALPESDVAQCLALADRLDSLIGIFAIGQKPSGVKDPFALRRAALGVVRILIEKALPVDLRELCEFSFKQMPETAQTQSVVDEVIDYILDRLRAYYQEQGIGFDIVDAVISTNPTVLFDSDQRVKAVARFQSNEAALALAAANKRISNILKKQGKTKRPPVNPALLTEAAEIELYQQLEKIRGQANELFADGSYLEGLELLAKLRPEVDQFFDDVMVMIDDEDVKNNRLALLEELLSCFRRVADFSRLQS